MRSRSIVIFLIGEVNAKNFLNFSFHTLIFVYVPEERKKICPLRPGGGGVMHIDDINPQYLKPPLFNCKVYI